MSAKPIILVLLQYYLPGYKSGGPVRSIEGLGEHLGEKLDFRVAAYDRDSGDSEPYPTVQIGGWQRVGKTEVNYVSKALSRWTQVFHLLREEPVNLLYLQSLFNPCFTLWPLLLRRIGLIPFRPVLLAPRGELSKGALSIRPLKKRYFLAVGRIFGLFNGVHWQASTELEAAEIRASGLLKGGKIHVASNLRVVPPAQESNIEQRLKPNTPLRLVFVSRIAPKKNLDGALRALQEVKVPVRFDIHGPIDRDKDYWAECQKLIRALPDHVKAEFHGPSAPELIPWIFDQADAFLFPTFGENFGHVIAEALLAGCPVILSDQTPWNGLSEAGCGANLAPDDIKGFAKVIEQFAMNSLQIRKEQRSCARQFGIEGLGLEDSIETHKEMFAALLSVSNP
ncbi:glycosyltransferase [Akkermansiaceae bacterium]|nr:glycosyltransferase [Akkermansiaceae bacterium]MDB4636729.1 glycosyltransferase [Akkermansiaceae bacterium]